MHRAQDPSYVSDDNGGVEDEVGKSWDRATAIPSWKQGNVFLESQIELKMHLSMRT